MLRLSKVLDLKEDVYPLIPTAELSFPEESTNSQNENFLVPKTFTKETICLRIVGESSHGLLICREGYHKAKRGQKTFLDLYDSEKHSLTTLYIHPRAHVNVCSASVDSSLSLLSFTMFYSTQMGNRKQGKGSGGSKKRIVFSSFLVLIQPGGTGDFCYDINLQSYKPQFVEFVPSKEDKKSSKRVITYLFFFQKKVYRYQIQLHKELSQPKFLRILGFNPDCRYLWASWDPIHSHLYLLHRASGAGGNEESSETNCQFSSWLITETSEILLSDITIPVKLWNGKNSAKNPLMSPMSGGVGASGTSGGGSGIGPIHSLNASSSLPSVLEQSGGSSRSHSPPRNQSENLAALNNSLPSSAPSPSLSVASSLGSSTLVSSGDRGNMLSSGDSSNSHVSKTHTPFILDPDRAYRRILSPENSICHLVHLQNGGICLCQQHLQSSFYGCIDVSVYMLAHRSRVDISIPLLNIDGELSQTRVHFNTICDMVMIFVPGEFMHLLDCGVTHKPLLGPTVDRNFAPHLPNHEKTSDVWIKPFRMSGRSDPSRGFFLDCNKGIAYQYSFNREAILQMFLSRPSSVQVQIVHLAMVHLQDRELTTSMFTKMCQQAPQNFVIPLQREFLIAASYLAVNKAPSCALSQIRVTTIEDFAEYEDGGKKKQRTTPFRHVFNELSGYSAIWSMASNDAFFVYKKVDGSLSSKVETKTHPLWETISNPQVINLAPGVRGFLGRLVEFVAGPVTSPEAEFQAMASSIDITASDFYLQVDSTEFCEQLAFQISQLFPKEYRFAMRDALICARDYRRAQIASMKKLFDHLKTGNECEKSLIFQAYESCLCVSEEMDLPLPSGFQSQFALLGFLCLPQSLFLQYVDRKVIRVTLPFINQVAEILSITSPSSSEQPSSPRKERKRREERVESGLHLHPVAKVRMAMSCIEENHSSFFAHSIYTCTNTDCNPDCKWHLRQSDRLFLFSLISHMGDHEQFELFYRYCSCLRLVAENIGYRLGTSRELETDVMVMGPMDEKCQNSMFLPMSAYLHVTKSSHRGFQESCHKLERYLTQRYQILFDMEEQIIPPLPEDEGEEKEKGKEREGGEKEEERVEEGEREEEREEEREGERRKKVAVMSSKPGKPNSSLMLTSSAFFSPPLPELT